MQQLAEDIAKQLSLAQLHLSRGDLVTAGAVLRRISQTAVREQAMRVAEMLIAARLPDEATNLAERIARESVDVWPWLNQFAGHMRARGLLDPSTRVTRAFIDAHPERSRERMQADIVLALGLPAIYRDRAELDIIRHSYLRQLNELIVAYPCSALKDIGARPDDLARSNFHLAYQGQDDLIAQSIYGDWLVQSMNALAEAQPVLSAINSRPTIALVSGKWNECTVGWYFASWVEHLAQSWDVALVHTPGARRDALTRRLSALCRTDVMLPQSIDSAAAHIRALNPDIVLYPELGTDGFTFAMAAQRLAPIQACAWGHPVTTGLSTIDVFFSSDVMEPEDATEHYRERLVGLPGIGTRYTAPTMPEPSAMHIAGLAKDHPLYLMPQAIFKWHPDTDRYLVEIVRRDPAARFVLFELRPPSPALVVNERLLRALQEVSANPTEHLIWMPECSRDDYLRINQACAVMIDTPHWSGGNATLDALLCGLPVVTLPGRFMRGRQSLGMLRMLGCEELIADSPEQLAEIAVALTRDKTRRQALSDKIRERLPSVTQSEAPLIALETCLKGMLENLGARQGWSLSDPRYSAPEGAVQATTN